MLSARLAQHRVVSASLIGLALAACEPPPTQPATALAPHTRQARGQDIASADGAFFVGNFGFPVGAPNNGVLRYDARGAFVDAFVPSDLERFVIPCCFTFGPDDHLYVASPIFETILRFNGATGELIDEFVSAPEGGLGGVLAPQFGPDGNLYVGQFGADFASPSIRRYDGQTGAFIDVFVQPNGGGMVAAPDPQLFTWGPDGHLYVAAPVAGKVLRFDGRTGEFIDAFVTNLEGQRISGLVFGADGLLYVNSYDAVRRYDAGTGDLVDVFVEPGSGGLAEAVGMVFGPDGHLYVASAATGAVLRYDGSTGAFIDEFIPAGHGGSSGPRMIAFKTKMRVCHRAPGDGEARTLSVGQLAAADHVAHGDRVGACEAG